MLPSRMSKARENGERYSESKYAGRNTSTGAPLAEARKRCQVFRVDGSVSSGSRKSCRYVSKRWRAATTPGSSELLTSR